ncbi:MAG: hypothetical protein CEE38_00805 [Planctomycetes bacterium B3_Pla]|nr:MAG: hypothetical protein CEE38_00805 [Planctomycetes bacterium B3_Pla]
MKNPRLFQVVVEGILVVVGLATSVIMYFCDSGGSTAILVGVLVYLTGSVVVLRIELHQFATLAATTRPATALMKLEETYRAAEVSVGPRHVFLDWLNPRIEDLTTKVEEVTRLCYSSSHERLDMVAAYDWAYRRKSAFKACCPQETMEYFFSATGKVFLRSIWDLHKSKRITHLKRLFVIDQNAVGLPEFEKLSKFHDAAGWEMYWIDTSELENAVMGQLSKQVDKIKTKSFAIHGRVLICEAFEIVNDRARVCFWADSAKIKAYTALFDAACTNGVKLRPTVAFGKTKEFDTAYDKFMT